MRSSRKTLTRLRGTNFCTSSARFSPSFVRQPNVPKCTQMVRNSPKHEFRVQWVDRVHSLRTIPMQLRGTNFCTSSARFAASFVRQPNDPKCTQNMILGSDRVGRVRSLRNIANRLRGTNLCPSSARFPLSFLRQPNGPKCTQMVRNAPKHEFMVQWDRSGAFVANQSDATSWHKLLP